MDVYGCPAGLELGSRHASKRKRFGEGAPDESVPAKRQLTEEAMASIMHQLRLSSASTAAPQLPTTVSITAVASCPSASTTAAEVTCRPGEPLIEGTPPLVAKAEGNSSSVAVPQSSREQLASAVTENLTLSPHPNSSSVHIRVTPATPPSSEALSQEEWEPMEQSLFSLRAGQEGVVLEDISSDSSDSEMPPKVWIAPELKSLAARHRHILPAPILETLARNEMAVVPWMSREQCFNRTLARMKERELEGGEDSSGEDTDTDEEKGHREELWDNSMH